MPPPERRASIVAVLRRRAVALEMPGGALTPPVMRTKAPARHIFRDPCLVHVVPRWLAWARGTVGGDENVNAGAGPVQKAMTG